MINITSSPPLLSPAKNPLRVELTSDNMYSQPGSNANLVFGISAKPAAELTLILTWNSKSIVFTTKTTPLNNGIELPIDTIPAGGSMSEYTEYVLFWLKKNYFLTQDFEVFIANGWIALGAKNPGSQYSISRSGSWSSGITNVQSVAGSNRIMRDNFCIMLQLLILQDGLYAIHNEEYLQCNNLQVASADLGSMLDEHPHPSPYFEFPETLKHHNRSALIKKYKIRYAEMYGSVPQPQGVYESGVFFSFPGHVSDRLIAMLTENLSDFYQYYLTRLFFLHSGELTRSVDVSEVQKLYWINAGQYSLINSKAIISYYDNADVTVTLSTFQSANMQLHELCAGYAINNIGTVTPGKQVSKYKFYLEEDLTGDRISPFMTYEIDYRYFQNPRYFLYRNNYGMFDTFRFTGEGATKFQGTKQTIETVLPLGYTTRNAKQYTEPALPKIIHKVNSGWLNSRRELERCLEMIFSHEIYEIIAGKLYPVHIITDNGEFYNDDNTRFNLTLEYVRDSTEEIIPISNNGGFSQGFSDGFRN